MREADKENAGVQAWKVAPPPKEALEERPEWTATLGQWLLRHPYAHPGLLYFTVAVVHLRPIEGVRPAALQLRGATHELLMVPLAPQSGTDPDNAQGFRFWPPSVVVQFQARDDAQAQDVLQRVVDMLVQGEGDPTQASESGWCRLVRHWTYPGATA